MEGSGGAIDYQDLLLGVDTKTTAPASNDLSTIHVPLTIPDNVDVRQLRFEEEINRMFYNVKSAALWVAQCIMVEDNEPIPALFYLDDKAPQRDVFNTQNPSIRLHI